MRDLVGPGFGFVPLAPRPDEQKPPAECWELSEVDGLVPWMQSHPTETGATPNTSVPEPDLPRPAIDEPEDSEPTASPTTAPTPANPNAAGTAIASPRLAKSPRSGGPSGTPRPLAIGSRWQRLALVAALFLLPLILVETALRSWASAREQQFDDRLASQLRADLAWMERSNEPRQQLGLWLRRQFDEICQHALRSPDPRQALPNLVLPLMRRLHQLLPSLSIDLSVLPDPGNGTADTGDTRIVASQGTDVWFSAAERQYIVDLLYADLPHTFASGAVLADVPHWFDPARTLATEPARAALLSSLGAFRPLWSNGLRYAFSQPFISPRWWNHPRRIAAFESGLDVLASTTAVVLRQHLWGLLTFRVTPSDLTTNLLWRCAAGNLRHEGAILAIQPIGARRGMRIVPAVFRNHAGLRAVLRGQIRDRQVSGAWRCVAGTVLLDQPYRVVVARRTTRPQSSTDRIYELRGFLVLLWLALGLAMARRILAGSETWTWSLTAILSGTFLIVLLPALFVGMQLQERDLRERGDQVESEGRRTLDLIVARVDEGTRVYDAWYCALIERWLENAALFERIMNLARHQPGGSDSPAQPLFEKIVLERMRPMGLDLIMAMLVTTRDEGTFVPRPEQPINRTKQMMDRKVGIALLRNSLESMFRPEDQQATALKGAVEAVVGAEVENFLTAMAQMLPPKISAHMLAAPRSQVQVRLSETRDAEYLYRSYLQNPGQPTTLLRLSWLMGSCFRQHLQAWDEALQQDPALAGISRLTTSQRFQPAWALARPYFTFRKWVPDKPPRLVRRNHLQPPDAANVVALTAMSGEPTARVIGTGEQRRLLMAVPGVQQRDQVFLGEIPIGQILGEAQRQVQTVRWWLALLVVLTVALSLQVARRFLAPVLALADAAARITAGDFQARLPRLTGDSEFAVLARSFNAMADGVAEGRLLGRFVPEAALAATRDRDRSEQARSGVAREAVVVFVSLAGFKPLLTGSDAGELVGGLNATLQRFSRVIRQHGGEIDKFIGEKILAVFHPRDDNHLATPVQGALAAAEEIRRLSRQFAVEEGNRDETQPLALPVGIGIVAGPILAGILGAPEVRLEYTVIGDTVNLASRLCDLALSLPGAGIVLDGNVARVIGAEGDTERWPRLRRLAVQRVKGKSRQVEVHLLAEVSR